MAANDVVAKLSTNPNVFVATSLKFLPILDFLSEVADAYSTLKETLVAKDTPLNEKEKLLNEYLDSEIEVPEVSVGVSTLRNCGLTMISIQAIRWWIVEFEDEYED